MKVEPKKSSMAPLDRQLWTSIRSYSTDLAEIHLGKPKTRKDWSWWDLPKVRTRCKWASMRITSFLRRQTIAIWTLSSLASKTISTKFCAMIGQSALVSPANSKNPSRLVTTLRRALPVKMSNCMSKMRTQWLNSTTPKPVERMLKLKKLPQKMTKKIPIQTLALAAPTLKIPHRAKTAKEV